MSFRHMNAFRNAHTGSGVIMMALVIAVTAFIFAVAV